LAIIVDQRAVEGKEVTGDGAAGLLYKTLFAPGEGRLLSANLVSVAPQGVTRKHRHEWEQVNYILAGTGVLLTGDNERRVISAGTAVHIAANELHWFENDGKVELVILGVLGPNAK